MDFAAKIESEIEAALSRDEPETLRAAARLLCLNTAAKRARPLLVERFGVLLGLDVERLVPVAVAAELIHSASLLHDDVIDGAEERRGAPSANAVHGNRVAVLAGDLLIAVALGLLKPLPQEVTAAAIDTIAAMTRAAMWEIEAAFDDTLDERRWRQIALGKTGSLLAFCGRSAGLLAGQPTAEAAFARGAEHLGCAFQAADDLADLKDGTGKPRFQDLRHGNPSLVTAKALAFDAGLRESVKHAWASRSGGEIAADLVESLGHEIVHGPAVAMTKAGVAADVAAAADHLGPWLVGEPGAALLAWGQSLLADDFFTDIQKRS